MINVCFPHFWIDCFIIPASTRATCCCLFRVNLAGSGAAQLLQKAQDSHCCVQEMSNVLSRHTSGSKRTKSSASQPAPNVPTLGLGDLSWPFANKEEEEDKLGGAQASPTSWLFLNPGWPAPSSVNSAQGSKIVNRGGPKGAVHHDPWLPPIVLTQNPCNNYSHLYSTLACSDTAGRTRQLSRQK